MNERIQETPREATVAARSDVVVVGAGPAGFAAAVAARREGASVTLLERYPYLGGLASGGMVLVLALGVFLPLWSMGQAASGRG